MGLRFVFRAPLIRSTMLLDFFATFSSSATGAADAVSMVFRNVIRQLETPDALRGRMTGVNMVFFMGGP